MEYTLPPGCFVILSDSWHTTMFSSVSTCMGVYSTRQTPFSNSGGSLASNAELVLQAAVVASGYEPPPAHDSSLFLYLSYKTKVFACFDHRQPATSPQLMTNGQDMPASKCPHVHKTIGRYSGE